MAIRAYVHTNRLQPMRPVFRKALGSRKGILLITGYLDLHELGHLIIEWNDQPALAQPVRILLGYPPAEYQPEALRRSINARLPDIVVEGVMNQGLSPRNAPWLLELRNALTQGTVDVRFDARQHCKLFCATGENPIAFNGSANLTRMGMSRRLGEILVEHVDGLPELPDILAVAEQFWEEGESFNEELAKAIDRLIRITSWQDVLAITLETQLSARLADEVLDKLNIDIDQVWYHQRLSAQILMHIVQEHGLAICANTLGSGKTKTLCTVMAFLEELTPQHLTSRSVAGVVLTPANPLIQESWSEQLMNFGLDQQVISRGIPSAGPVNSPKKFPRLMKLLINGRQTVIDEGQQYVNPSTNCSSAIRDRNSLFTLFSTATPLQGNIRDGYLLTEGLIGIDNLPPRLLTDYQALRTVCQKLEARQAERLVEPMTLLSEANRLPLLREFYHFLHDITVRVTPEQIDRFIRAYPESYRRVDGTCYRYPEIETAFVEPCRKRRSMEMALSLGIHSLVYQMSFIGLQLNLCVNGLRHSKKKLSRTINTALPLKLEELNILMGDHLLRYERMWQITYVNLLSGQFTECSFAALELLLGTDWAMSQPEARGEQLGHLLKERQRGGEIIGWAARWEDIFKEYCEVHKGDLSEKEVKQIRQMLNHDLALVDDLKTLLLTYAKPWNDMLWESMKRVLGDSQTYALTFANSPVCQAYWADRANREDPERNHMFVAGSRDAEKLSVFNRHSPKPQKAQVAWLTNALTEGYNAHRASITLNLSVSGSLNFMSQRFGRLYRLDSPHDKIVIYYLRPVCLGIKRINRLSHAAAFVDTCLGPTCDWPQEIDAFGFEDLLHLLDQKAKISVVKPSNSRQEAVISWLWEQAKRELTTLPIGSQFNPTLSHVCASLIEQYQRSDILRAAILNLRPRRGISQQLQQQVRQMVRESDGCTPSTQQRRAQQWTTHSSNQSAYSALADLISEHPLASPGAKGLIDFTMYQSLERRLRNCRCYYQLARVPSVHSWAYLCLEIPNGVSAVYRLALVHCGKVELNMNVIGQFLTARLAGIADTALSWNDAQLKLLQRHYERVLGAIRVVTYKEERILNEMAALANEFIRSSCKQPLTDLVATMSLSRQAQLDSIDLRQELFDALPWLHDRALREYWLDEGADPVPLPGELASAFWSRTLNVHQEAKQRWQLLRDNGQLPPRIGVTVQPEIRNWEISEALAMFLMPDAEAKAWRAELLYALIITVRNARPLTARPCLVGCILGCPD